MALEFPYPVNALRYTPWGDLDAGIQTILQTSLAYVEVTWNNPGTYLLEEAAFVDLGEEQSGVMQIGFTEETWDCWVNHYVGYGWAGLAAEEVQQYWITLGWTSGSWIGVLDPPPSDALAWTELNETEQAAAVQLCFFEELWDSIPLTEWEVEQSVAPSEMPSEAPSKVQSEMPSEAPSKVQSEMPSEMQSEMPSEAPSEVQSEMPSESEITSGASEPQPTSGVESKGRFQILFGVLLLAGMVL